MSHYVRISQLRKVLYKFVDEVEKLEHEGLDESECNKVRAILHNLIDELQNGAGVHAARDLPHLIDLAERYERWNNINGVSPQHRAERKALVADIMKVRRKMSTGYTPPGSPVTHQEAASFTKCFTIMSELVEVRRRSPRRIEFVFSRKVRVYFRRYRIYRPTSTRGGDDTHKAFPSTSRLAKEKAAKG